MGSTATQESVAEELCLLEAEEARRALAKMGIIPDTPGYSPIAKTKIEPNDFKALCGPGVYIFWMGKKALYVGVGRRVMNRMSNPNHGAVGRALLACTEIEILFFADEGAAGEQETRLIRDLQPLLNRRGLGSRLDD